MCEKSKTVCIVSQTGPNDEKNRWLLNSGGNLAFTNGAVKDKTYWVLHYVSESEVKIESTSKEHPDCWLYLKPAMGTIVLCSEEDAKKSSGGVWHIENGDGNLRYLKSNSEGGTDGWLTANLSQGTLTVKDSRTPESAWRFFDSQDYELDVCDMLIADRLPDFRVKVFTDPLNKSQSIEKTRASDLLALLKGEQTAWDRMYAGCDEDAEFKDFFDESNRFFIEAVDRVEHLRQVCVNGDEVAINGSLSKLQERLNNIDGVVFVDSVVGQKLLNLLKTYPIGGVVFHLTMFPRACKRVRAKTAIYKKINLFDPQAMKGVIAAYDLQNPDSSIAQDVNAQRESLSELAAEISTGFSSALDRFQDFRNNCSDELDKYKSRFEASQEAFDENYKQREARLVEKERALTTEMGMRQPVKYWQTYAKVKRQAGKTAMVSFIVLIAVTIILALCVVYSPPRDMGASTITPSFIRTSLMIAACFSLLIYGMRIALKFAMSNYHLSSDATERANMTKSYLAMLSESPDSIKKEERVAILTAIFGRADTGLLKSDGHPFFPLVQQLKP